MARRKDQIHYGLHTVQHALEQTPESVLELWVAESRKASNEVHSIMALAKQNSVTVQRVHPATLDELTGSEKHQGVAIRRLPPRVRHEDDLMNILENKNSETMLFLVLDGIQDPHNLGACLRTADATGVNAVIAPKDNAVSLTATVSKVASGAAETVPFITVTNLARTLRSLKEANVWLIGTDDEADQDIYDANLSGHIAVVMGAEGGGLRQNTRKHCDDLVKLPMVGSVASLNVSVATGVCLYEVLRQRLNQ